MFRVGLLVASVVALFGCGIKGPPRPPTAEPPVAQAAPDAGCCR